MRIWKKDRKREKENLASVLEKTIDQCNFCWTINFQKILLEIWLCSSEQMFPSYSVVHALSNDVIFIVSA
jgi:hypothetical protein